MLRGWSTYNVVTRIYFCLFFLLPWLAACEQTQVATPEPVTITIAGATGMRPVLQALTAEFSRRHPSVIFDLRGGGSSIGEQLVSAGEVDLGASVMLPSVETESVETPEAQKLFRVPIGIDGIAIIVHTANKVNSLSLAQLRDLFSGKIVNWSALGGDSSDVVLVSREDGSGSRLLFESKVMGAEAVSLTAVVMPTSADVVDYVAKNPEAVGYVSRSYVVGELGQMDFEGDTAIAQNPSKIKVISLEGKLPTLLAIKDSSYLLSGPILLIGKGELAGWKRQFIEFVLGPVGQQIVERYHARVR